MLHSPLCSPSRTAAPRREHSEPWSGLLESRGYTPAEAKNTVLTVLPDVLHYDRNRPGALPQRPGSDR
jgi:hypothetical protein